MQYYLKYTHNIYNIQCVTLEYQFTEVNKYNKDTTWIKMFLNHNHIFFYNILLSRSLEKVEVDIPEVLGAWFCQPCWIYVVINKNKKT